jgi:hypothetical protein
MSSSDRRPYLTATALNQALLDACQDNLTNQLEPIVEIEAPDGEIIRASDRNKFVGEHFYEALTTFPTITRTIGDWLGGGIQFSEVELEISNADARFNRYLPGGDDFDGWVGRLVTVKVGLRDVEATYLTIFRGRVSEDAGFGRTVKSIIVRARDELEKVNIQFPTALFTDTTYPKADDTLWGTPIPAIYGDWTTAITPGAASVPAYPVNARDLFVNDEDLSVLISNSSPAVFTAQNHRLDSGDRIALSTDGTLPTGLAPSDYEVATVIGANQFTVRPVGGGAEINTSSAGSGNHQVRRSTLAALENVKLVISSTDLSFFAATTPGQVFLRRSSLFFAVPPSSIVTVGAGNRSFELKNADAGFLIDGTPWQFANGDEFYVRCKGKDLGAYDDNAVSIARDILTTYAGVVSGDLDSTWDALRDKASPAESAIASIKARAWVKEPQAAMEYVISLLEQVRVEIFVNRDLKLSLSALHFDAMSAAPSFTVRNWDVEKDSFQPKIDERNNFNRARAIYGYLPILAENAFSTSYFRNDPAITQQGRTITRAVVYPNLYRVADVEAQLQEVLKLASAYREVIACTLTSRAFLQDVGGFVRLNVMIGSSQFSNVPCQIRDLGYEPGGLKLPVKLWSFSMIPFPGWAPGYPGTVGGSTATITREA